MRCLIVLFQVNGLHISNLQKAGETIQVDLIANHLTEDTDGEIVLKEAFSDETVQSFIDHGVIDYWHDSKNPKLSKEDRNGAIIGKPIAFKWENGKPVITANLTKSHPRVQEMLPHLEANQAVYGASIGGSKMVLKTTDSLGKEHKIIPRINWDHLAIAPSPDVINRGSGLNVRLSKANDIMCEFSDMEVFSKNMNIIGKEEELRKALEAPSSASDLYNTPGGVITKQSLEPTIANLTLTEQDGLDFIDTIIGISKKKIPMKKADYINYFASQKKEDFGRKSYGLIDKYFKLKKGAN